MPKNVEGGLFGIYQHTFSCKISKNLKGEPFETLENFQKKSHNVVKKSKGGGPLVSSGFVGYVKKVKNERDPFALISADRTWPYGSSFSRVRL